MTKKQIMKIRNEVIRSMVQEQIENFKEGFWDEFIFESYPRGLDDKEIEGALISISNEVLKKLNQIKKQTKRRKA